MTNSIALKLTINAFFNKLTFKIITSAHLLFKRLTICAGLSIEEKAYQLATEILIISLNIANDIHCIRNIAYNYCSTLKLRKIQN
ncbi:hypothetical protein D3C73_1202640 [compost metagenome]